MSHLGVLLIGVRIASCNSHTHTHTSDAACGLPKAEDTSNMRQTWEHKRMLPCGVLQIDPHPGVVWSYGHRSRRRRGPQARRQTGCTVRNQGGYRIRLIAPVTSDIQESHELGFWGCGGSAFRVLISGCVSKREGRSWHHHWEEAAKQKD